MVIMVVDITWITSIYMDYNFLIIKSYIICFILIMLLNLKGIVMSQKLYIHKIDTADIAQDFTDFVQKEF